MADEKADRLYRLMEDARREVEKRPEWRRSDETNRELKKLAEERQQTSSKPKNAGR